MPFGVDFEAMKLATIRNNGKLHLAMIQGDAAGGDFTWLPVADVPGFPVDIGDMQGVIDQAATVLPILTSFDNQAGQQQWRALDKSALVSPIPHPRRNIICLGWNYAEHAKESSAAKDIVIDNLPEHPIVFTKATTTMNAPFADVLYDETVTCRLDWEVELGVVIGREGRHIPEAEALDYVFGYTVINDISARDLQKRHQQFFLGKSVDGTCPMGPWIVTADEIPEPQNLRLTCKVNKENKQDGNTRQMIFAVANIISALSKVMTLLPGDILATGTPSGVGFARTPPEYLKAGDMVECEIEKIGIIRNHIVTIK